MHSIFYLNKGSNMVVIKLKMVRQSIIFFSNFVISPTGKVQIVTSNCINAGDNHDVEPGRKQLDNVM